MNAQSEMPRLFIKRNEAAAMVTLQRSERTFSGRGGKVPVVA
jgi:hypothetical protein